MWLSLGIPALAVALWGCAAQIGAAYRIDLYPASGWLSWALAWSAPWIALIAGFLVWKQARLLRQLQRQRMLPHALARDPYRLAPPPDRPGGLERLGRWSMTVGAIALLYWFSAPAPEILLAIGLLLWAFKALVLSALRGAAR